MHFSASKTDINAPLLLAMDTSGAAAGGGVCTDPREQCDGDWSFWCDLLEAMLYQGKVPAKAKARPTHAWRSPVTDRGRPARCRQPLLRTTTWSQHSPPQTRRWLPAYRQCS